MVTACGRNHLCDRIGEAGEAACLQVPREPVHTPHADGKDNRVTVPSCQDPGRAIPAGRPATGPAC